MMKIKVLNAETLGKINEINLDLVTNGNREYVVGRSSKSGLILDSHDVSRQHGKFYLLDGNYYYSDLASINGSLVNNKLVECDRSYLLKPGDIVRIGEFLLVLEEEVEEPEIAATVYNANIDWRTALNINLPEVPKQVTEDVNTSLQDEQAVDAEVNITCDDNQVLDLNTVQEIENEASEEQQNLEQENKLGLDNGHISELTTIQAEQTIIQDLEAENEQSKEQQNLGVENQLDSDDEYSSELTTIQASEVEAEKSEQEQTPKLENQLDLDNEYSSELTTIQASEIEAEESEQEKTPELENQLNLDNEYSSELTTIQASEVEAEKSEQEKTPELENQLNLDNEYASELTTIQMSKVEAEESEQQQNLEVDNEYTSELKRNQFLGATSEESEENTSEMYTSSGNDEFNNMSRALDAEIINEPAVDDRNPEEVKILNNNDSLQANSDAQVADQFETVSELATQTTEEISEDSLEDVNEVEADIAAQTPEFTNKAFEIISKKYIALMAHDSKKSELVDFVAQHQEFLSKCLTISTPVIAELLFQETGLIVSQKTPLVPVGGYQGVASLVGTGEALAVLLLKDFLVPQTNQANEDALLRLCNINQVLVATNVSTAEAIVHYIKDMVSSL
ncbi:FHA domain-containing protein [Nostoc sp. FACHB-152]|uniref:FHA domain-containing protein n=1 Tax=unclassified Nostoc TaxID=2593658 RepID=UPI001688BAE7|nr:MULTISPECIES: FHA domain-containing protein [unclassified Nostoc]MBD2449749.1 FHA domain-containing protein [Nostoc sp. FACHB-152]MBD2469874.1 FHA domain-containing protein [Nostoc sp. FACHB-145]